MRSYLKVSRRWLEWWEMRNYNRYHKHRKLYTKCALFILLNILWLSYRMYLYIYYNVLSLIVHYHWIIYTGSGQNNYNGWYERRRADFLWGVCGHGWNSFVPPSYDCYRLRGCRGVGYEVVCSRCVLRYGSICCGIVR